MKKICINCNKEFKVLSCFKNRKFCSHRCSEIYHIGIRHPKWKLKIKKICLICNKEFEVYPSWKDKIFCSKKCYGIYRTQYYIGKNNPSWKGEIKKNCLECNNEFLVYLYEKDNKKFCSRKCVNIYQARNRIGENAANWQGGISFEPYCKRFNDKLKEKIRDRDNRICQLCNKTEIENKEKLSIHHVHYDKENCYPDLISLCRVCNSKVNSNRDYWEEYFMKILKIKDKLK